MAITYPPVFINQYLAEKVVELIPDQFSSNFKFFATSPTDIDSLTEGFPEASNDVFAVYDRMLKYRKTSFPHIKSEQTIYYIYKSNNNQEGLIETIQIIHDLLDREDESAQEINSWINSKINNGVVTFGSGLSARDFKPVFFHNIKMFQLQESTDIINFTTNRTYAGNKIIVDYEYHTTNY
jgi:hypothetical protein